LTFVCHADNLLIPLSPVICEVQTLGNNLSVGLITGYSSVHMAGGASDRR